ncbi:hypothetical protein GpartN1_g2253.t1 [Galdieria partita]|uniref:CWF19-like protein 2 n=1 Tax=Galdieria partita TaxID=83374 RepID=A0A9C7UPG4_9RHOD|nr:hypothetical protein GpartN1_g2253.t1 [Galdieria partita]
MKAQFHKPRNTQEKETKSTISKDKVGEKKNYEEKIDDKKDNKTVAEALRAKLNSAAQVATSTTRVSTEEKQLDGDSIQENDYENEEVSRNKKHKRLNEELYRMLREERVGSASNDEILARYSSQENLLKGIDDAEIEDIVAESYYRKNSLKGKRFKSTSSKQLERNNFASSRVLHNESFERTLEQCRFCFENLAHFQLKHLLISFGNFTYLSLVRDNALAKGHCFISTTTHHVSSRQLSEEIFEEIVNFKKSLYRMFFETERKEVIFFETCKDFQRQRQHLVVECVPLPRADASECPAFFKKAILESESEWSDNKKLIETDGWRGLRNRIPENFPYFHVQFGSSGGYCHIIEDEENFPWNFGRQVVAGILKLDPPSSRVALVSSYTMEQDMERLKWFLTRFEPYDWTRLLDQPQ